jgi:hypothetical protein
MACILCHKFLDSGAALCSNAKDIKQCAMLRVVRNILLEVDVVFISGFMVMLCVMSLFYFSTGKIQYLASDKNTKDDCFLHNIDDGRIYVRFQTYWTNRLINYDNLIVWACVTV